MILEHLKGFSLVHEMNVVRMCQLVAPDRHLRWVLLQRLSSIFHRELSSGEEVVPEEHEVLLLVALALRLQPGQDALGGVPAAQVHLEDQDQAWKGFLLHLITTNMECGWFEHLKPVPEKVEIKMKTNLQSSKCKMSATYRWFPAHRRAHPLQG